MANIRKRGPYQWQATIRKTGYPVQFKTFENKTDAEAWSGQVEAEMHRGVYISIAEAERTTLSEALDRYEREIASQKKHPHQERQRVRRWQKDPLALRYLATLRGTDFAKYRDQRRADGRAENTIRLELAIVAHLFEIARKEWGMEGLLNPLNNIRKPSGSRERDRRLLPGEYDQLLTALQGSDNPWVAPAFQLAIESSLRQGMLMLVRWEWVDLQKKVILIPAQFRNTGNKGVPPAIPLSSRALAVLAALPRSLDGRLFPTSQNALRCVWKRTLETLKIKDLHWHDLRHEAASRLFEHGLNPMEVASITGHKSLNMLRRYTHLKASDLVARLG